MSFKKLTVKELKEKLESFPDELQIVICDCHGDNTFRTAIHVDRVVTLVSTPNHDKVCLMGR